MVPLFTSSVVPEKLREGDREMDPAETSTTWGIRKNLTHAISRVPEFDTVLSSLIIFDKEVLILSEHIEPLMMGHLVSCRGQAHGFARSDVLVTRASVDSPSNLHLSSSDVHWCTSNTRCLHPPAVP